MKFWNLFKRKKSSEQKTREQITKRWEKFDTFGYIEEEIATLTRKTKNETDFNLNVLTNTPALIQEYKDTIRRLNSKLDEKNKTHNLKAVEAFNNENGECPKCKSHNIIDKISQVKGEISGHNDYFGGSLKGSIDTIGINQCRDCGNEWKKTELHKYKYDMDSELIYLRIMIGKYIAYIDCTFDPLDIKDINFNSLKEKQSKLLEQADNAEFKSSVIDFWQGTRIDVLMMILKQLCDKNLDIGSYNAKKIKSYFIDRPGNYVENMLVEKLGFIK